MLLQRIQAECNFVISRGEPSYLKTVEQINEYFVSLVRPQKIDFDSSDSEIVKHETTFEQLCIALQINNITVKKMTVIEFYSAIVYFEQKKLKDESNRTRP